MKSRLHESYTKQTVPALMKRFNWDNSMAVPKLKKITVNIGLGEASQNAKLLDTAAVPLAMAVVLLGGLCMVVRRHTIAQLLGWLIVENGVFLGAITLVSGLAQRLASASAGDLRRLSG